MDPLKNVKASSLADSTPFSSLMKIGPLVLFCIPADKQTDKQTADQSSKYQYYQFWQFYSHKFKINPYNYGHKRVKIVFLNIVAILSTVAA